MPQSGQAHATGSLGSHVAPFCQYHHGTGTKSGGIVSRKPAPHLQQRQRSVGLVSLPCFSTAFASALSAQTAPKCFGAVAGLSLRFPNTATNLAHFCLKKAALRVGLPLGQQAFCPRRPPFSVSPDRVETALGRAGLRAPFGVPDRVGSRCTGAVGALWCRLQAGYPAG